MWLNNHLEKRFLSSFLRTPVRSLPLLFGGVGIIGALACCSSPSTHVAQSLSAKPVAASSSSPSVLHSAASSQVDFQDSALLDRIDSVVKPQIGTTHVGAVVAIINRGDIRFMSYGQKQMGGPAMTPDTLFEIGSITKTFTGLMLSRLIELGKVSLNESIDGFRPEWKGQRAGSITLQELVTHRSGLPRIPCDLSPKDMRNPYADYSENDLVVGLTDQRMSSLPNCSLLPHPTSDIRYSNWGMATLGYVLSVRENKPYEQLVRELILEPLNLNDTLVELGPSHQERMASGYNKSKEPTPLWDRKILFGAGALRSSPRDLVNYASAMIHPEKTTIAPSLLRAQTQLYSSDQAKIGYAWFVTPSGNIWHNGMTGGFSSFMKIYPKRELAVLYMTNTAVELSCFVEAVENIPCRGGK